MGQSGRRAKLDGVRDLYAFHSFWATPNDICLSTILFTPSNSVSPVSQLTAWKGRLEINVRGAAHILNLNRKIYVYIFTWIFHNRSLSAEVAIDISSSCLKSWFFAPLANWEGDKKRWKIINVFWTTDLGGLLNRVYWKGSVTIPSSMIPHMDFINCRAICIKRQGNCVEDMWMLYIVRDYSHHY